ncbi:MAG: hypothetical protein V1758_11580 [Pseudomonadota bacterium]
MAVTVTREKVKNQLLRRCELNHGFHDRTILPPEKRDSLPLTLIFTHT